METESENGKGWSAVANTYRWMDDENDATGATRITSGEVLAAIDAVLPLSKASLLLDIGCGPGQLIRTILDSPTELPCDTRFIAMDVSSAFVEMVQTQKQHRLQLGHNIWSRLEVNRWDAENLSKVEDGSVSHIVSSYAYQAMRDQEKALKEAVRVLMPGAAFVVTSSGKSQWSEIWTFIQEVTPQNLPVPPAGNPHMAWRSAEGVRGILERAGFNDTGAREYETNVPFDKYEDAIEWCSTGFPHVCRSFASMSEGEAKQVKDKMLAYLKDNFDTEPFRLKGTGVVGWGRR